MDELGLKLREHALLEGDFLLRSGRRSTYYLDKYRFETLPELLGPLGQLLPRPCTSTSPRRSGSPALPVPSPWLRPPRSHRGSRS